MPAAAIPTVDGMFSVWRADRCVQDASAHNYIRWIKWFRFYVNCLGLEERAELTQEGACRFAEWYGRHRRVDHKKMARAQTALHALNRVYEVMGLHPPKWSAPRPPFRPASALLQEYADYLARHRGSPPVTVQKRLTHVGRLLEHLADRDKTWSTMALADIDDFLVDLAQRFARATVADIAGSVRSFSRFLLATERTSVALADSVISPVPPRFERPRRSLPWEDVQRLLRAVDTSTARGLRDYALLLLMSTYGLGAGETIRLQFDDIDWVAGTAVRATELLVGDPPYPRQACQGRGPERPLSWQPCAAFLERGASSRSRDTASGAFRSFRSPGFGVDFRLCPDRH